MRVAMRASNVSKSLSRAFQTAMSRRLPRRCGPCCASAPDRCGIGTYSTPITAFESKGIDVGVLGSCAAKDIFGDELMREEGWADVRTRLEKFFSDRRCVRQLSSAKGSWLELPAGKVAAGILSEVKELMMRR